MAAGGRAVGGRRHGHPVGCVLRAAAEWAGPTVRSITLRVEGEEVDLLYCLPPADFESALAALPMSPGLGPPGARRVGAQLVSRALDRFRGGAGRRGGSPGSAHGKADPGTLRGAAGPRLEGGPRLGGAPGDLRRPGGGDGPRDDPPPAAAPGSSLHASCPPLPDRGPSSDRLVGGSRRARGSGRCRRARSAAGLDQESGNAGRRPAGRRSSSPPVRPGLSGSVRADGPGGHGPPHRPAPISRSWPPTPTAPGCSLTRSVPCATSTGTRPRTTPAKRHPAGAHDGPPPTAMQRAIGAPTAYSEQRKWAIGAPTA